MEFLTVLVTAALGPLGNEPQPGRHLETPEQGSHLI